MSQLSRLTTDFHCGSKASKKSPKQDRRWSGRIEGLEQRALLSISSPQLGPGLFGVDDGDVLDFSKHNDLDRASFGNFQTDKTDSRNPAVQTALLPEGVTRADLAAQLGEPSAAGANSSVLLPPPVSPLVLVGESEPNNSIATADPVPLGFGPGKDVSVDFGGSTNFVVPTLFATSEDDGSIPLANLTPLVSGSIVMASATIGDGPFGDTSGDYDFYQLAGLQFADIVTIDIDAAAIGSPLDSVLFVYDSSGSLLAFNDDFGSLDSLIEFPAPYDDDFYVAVFGFFSGEPDPFDSSSGGGADSTGAYNIKIGLNVQPLTIIGPTEDDGSIPLANPTGLVSGTSVGVVGFIGDGPFGFTSGDYDFYEVPSVAAGDVITVQIGAEMFFSEVDSVVGIYDAAGNVLAFNDQFSGNDSFLEFTAPHAGDYFVFVADFFTGGFLADPFDSSTGQGVGNIDFYIIKIGLNVGDPDFVAFDLEAGDILGGTVSGGADGLSLRNAAGEEMITSHQDASFIYPASSPLPGGGSAVLAWVIDTPGTYYVRTSSLGLGGSYDLNLRVFRPVLESEEVGTHQILFLDFDGATLNSSIFGGIGIANLSPLSSFLAGWGLSPADESAVIDAIVASVEENLSADIRALGNNGDYDATGIPGQFDIEIRNSRDHADPWGLPNVSRVVVGGTIPELGIGTIGIAQSIDVGNFDTTETAVVLLDLLSAPAFDPNSLNQYPIDPSATIFDLIGTGVGNITSHEAGHFFANFHTDQFNGFENADLMDQGGFLENIIGIGEDFIFGTPDDVDVDFGHDAFVPNEGFSGVENTLDAIAFGLSTGKVLDAPPVPIEFERLKPLGGLMSESEGNTGTIGFAGDDDGFSFYAAAGEKIGASLRAFSPGVGMTIELRSSGGALVASSGPMLAPVSFPADGNYVLHVIGSESTLFAMDIYRNASYEAQVGDSGPGNELDIDASLISLGSGRYGVIGITTPGLGSVANFYSQNFSGGLGGFVIDNGFGSGDGLWHLSSGRESDGDPNHSPPNSLYYGQGEGPTGGGNYDTGAENGGQVTSPLISLPLGEFTLSFNSLIETEDFVEFDVVQVLVDDGVSQTVLLSTFDGSLPTITSDWQTFTADLTPFAGKDVNLVFTFDTLDDFANEFEGWYIDDISIDGALLVPDVDEYEVDLTGKTGQPIDIVLEYQTTGFPGATLELLATNGSTVLATAKPDPLQVGTPAGNYDLGILGFIVPAGGVYTLRVSNIVPGTYGIVVTDPLTFETEPNDLETDPLRSLDQTHAALGFLGQATGGSRIFGVDAGAQEIVEFDPATGAELNRFALPEPIGGGAEGLAFNGASLFYGSAAAFGGGGILYELDPDTGAVIDSDAYADIGLSDAIDGLGVFGGQVIATDTFTSELFFVDTTTDLVVGSVIQPIDARGGATGAGARGTVFTNDFFGESIYEIDPATGAVVNSFAAPSSSVFGLAFVNGSLFAGDNGTGEIFELDPDTGAVLNSFATGVSLTALGGDDPGAVSPFGLHAVHTPAHHGDRSPYDTRKTPKGSDKITAYGPAGGTLVASRAVASPSAALEPAPVGDQYLLTIAQNELVKIHTSTPFDGASITPWNSLNPRLVIYGPSGSIVATDDNSAADGKNASLSFIAGTSGVYRIEVLAEDDTGEYVLHAENGPSDTVAPTVTSVVVSSPSWSASFLDYLQSHGLGTGGYAIPVGNGAAQLATLPWTNLRQIKLTFSENVVVAADDLKVVGVNVPNYALPPGGFSYNAATHVATWTLASNLNADKLLLALNSTAVSGVHDVAGNRLDGEWDNPTGTGDPVSDTFPSGNGAAGGHFNFRMNVLPGDTTGNQITFLDDLFMTALRVGANTSSSRFHPRHDVDGNGLINSTDLSLITARFISLLPSREPVAPVFPAAATAVVDRVFAEIGSKRVVQDAATAQLAFLDDAVNELLGAKKPAQPSAGPVLTVVTKPFAASKAK